MKKFLLGISLSILACFQCNSQSNDTGEEHLGNFKSGYILTNNNDSIRGFIYDKIDAELSNYILFKKDLKNAAVSTYKATDLLKFGFDNNRTFNSIKRLKKDKDTLFIFAKKIVEGKIDLWLVRDKKEASEFFLVNNKSNKKAHIFRPDNKDYLQIGGSTYASQDNKYLGILSVLKNEPVTDVPKRKRTKFSEKGIQEDIVKYNSKYSEDYPIEVYEEEYVYNYDITVGVPAFKFERGDFIRAAFYRNKINVEKSRNISKIQGISYHGWFDDKAKSDRQLINGTSNYRWQVLSIIPIGYKIQSTSRFFQPYAYAGLGVGILFMTDYKFVDSVNTGSETSVVPFPTLNLGAGARIKLGSKYLLAEITPSINGIFMNLGISF